LTLFGATGNPRLCVLAMASMRTGKSVLRLGVTSGYSLARVRKSPLPHPTPEKHRAIANSLRWIRPPDPHGRSPRLALAVTRRVLIHRPVREQWRRSSINTASDLRGSFLLRIRRPWSEMSPRIAVEPAYLKELHRFPVHLPRLSWNGWTADDRNEIPIRCRGLSS